MTNTPTSLAKKGFTIVELLIVVVVIAILAAITIVSYNGITRQAEIAALESQMKDMRTKLDIYRAEHGEFPRTVASFPDYKINKSLYDKTQNNIYYCLNTGTEHYAIGLRPRWNVSRGHMVTDTGIIRDVAVNGLATCQAAGAEAWMNDSSTVAIQGYSFSTDAWTTGWSWTR